MMNKIKKWFLNFLYGLPFGMKSANEEIMGGAENSDEGQNISQEVSDERVGLHLLKGEETESVQELRYRTYLAERKAKNYEYVGNGKAITKEVEKKEKKKIRFSQECKLLTESVLEGLKHIGANGIEKYTLDVAYSNPFVKFKFEQFTKLIDVKIDKEKNEILTTLHFENIRDGYSKKSGPFITSLETLCKVYDELKEKLTKENFVNYFNRNELIDSTIMIGFTTYKASDLEPDLIRYSFTKPSFVSIQNNGSEFLLTLKWESYEREDLTEKFFNKKMAENYAEKKKKDLTFDVAAYKERVAFCDVCGEEMNVYDADVTRYTYGKAMCKKCLSKYLLSQEN